MSLSLNFLDPTPHPPPPISFHSWLGWQIRQNPSKKNELAPGPAWANLGKSVSELHSTLTGAMALIFFLGANGGLVLSLVQDKVKQACWRICLQNPS